MSYWYSLKPQFLLIYLVSACVKVETKLVPSIYQAVIIIFLCKLQSIACGSIRRCMFSGGVLNWKKLTKYPRSVYSSQSEHFAISLSRLLPEVVTAINYSCTTTITKSSPAPPLNQSRHALPCEARLRSPENHSVL
ncbi:uncharacterized protein EAF02_007751 [Botrytis sinoallii]|uniref:uncharacterized protein n=1 Tax=Botrytis sinoallii TaxID=1463999 RepID=UPI0019029E42|nr:uncharacterized protein EAF02_007751 [Botrytis sinoallii]KAF7880114.1 hypothetical protein EAF02_007751 [Botrytis sinoallii]